MKVNTPYLAKPLFVALVTLFMSLQVTFAQDALTSIKVNVQNVTMSNDRKTISYDVYVQDVDATNQIAVPGYVIRLAVPQADLGTNAKTVTVTNACPELGASTPTMTTSSTNWLMKIFSANLITSYGTALMASETFPGTRLGTFNITNTDNTAFTNPQPFNLAWSGSTVALKSSVTIFNPNTTTTSTNSAAALPATSFSGLQSYSLSVAAVTTPLTISGVIASNKVYDGTNSATLTGGTLVGTIAPGDVVNLVAGTGTFSDQNAGNGKTVTATGYTLSGANAANYTITQPTGITANITTAPLSITGVTASNKVYNGNTTATLTGGALTGILSGDVVTLTAGTGTFADKNIGTGKTVTATGYTLGGANAANYAVSAQPSGLSANITAAPLSITGVTASNKAYDGATTATLTGGALTGIVSGDVVTITAGTGTFADKNLGTAKTVTATGYSLSGTGASNYTLSAQPSGLTANITAAPLTITGVTASNKVYDTFTTATLSGGTLSSVVSGDVVSFVAGTGTFADKNVGTGKTVTATGYTLSGANAGYYSLTQPTGITANITTAPISITGVAASNKVYNGNTTATMTGGSLTGVLSGDVVTLTAGTGTFADKNIGTGKTVTATGYTLGGANAANYAVSAQPSGLSANITAASLSITGVTASNKAYDGTTTATLTGGALTGIVSGDVVTITAGTGTFADKNLGTAKTVTATGYSLSGTGASNYTLSAQPSGLTANITAAPLTITGVTASNKVYDTFTTATLSGGTLSSVVSGDVVSFVAGTGTFADKNVGTGKTVTATGYTLSGANAGYYSLTQPTGITANITTAPISITGVAASNKVYNGNTTATMTGGSLTGVLSGDVVTLTAGTGTFADKNIGTGKTVTATGYTLGGANAANYAVSAQPSGLSASITAASLSITGVTASNKVYDGATTATLTGGALTGIVSGDVVTITAGTGTFVDKNIGTGKTVTAIGYGISGAGAINYTLGAQPSGITANITAAPLTISGVTASNKVYDASTSATLSGGTLSSVVSGDVVTITAGTGTFADKNVGTGKTVTATGYSLSGAGAANYSVSQPSGITANITTASLSISGVTASNKVYNGNTTATLAGGTLTGILSGDVVTITAGTGTFASKTIGTGKVVTATGYTLGGANAANYALSAQPSGLTANITAGSLSITGVTASNKAYDGTTTATLTGGTLVGVASGDVVTISAGTGTFADKNVGTGKVVTATGYGISGADAANYTLSAQPSGLTADILASGSSILTITGVTASNKVYDGTTTATLSGGTLVGVTPGDVVTIVAGTGTFADKNVGTGKSITASGYTLSGANAANYSLGAQPSGITANITTASLSISGVTASNKVYNGNTTATLAGGTLTGILSGDVVTITAGTGTFASKTIGTGKVVTATGYTLGGANSANYALSAQPSGLTANITAGSLSITGVTASNKTYDGTTTATLTGGTLVGVASGDVVTITAGTGTFADKNVGTGKVVTATGYSIGGADAANYTLSAQPSGLTADILASGSSILTITGVTASNKVYDGTTTATLSGGTLVGVTPGDVVTIVAGTGTFADKNVGTGKSITASGYTLSGANAANYSLGAQPSGITANITTASLSISGVTASNKVYNGNTTATLAGGTLTGILSGDVVTITAGTGTFASKTIGTGKVVTATGYTLGGANAANYALSAQPSGLTANITAGSLSITGVTASNKTYDGTTTATLTGGTLVGVASGDVVTITAGTGTFADKNVGTGKVVTATGYSIGGADAANYTLSAQPSGLTADILASGSSILTITGVTASNKVYDGTTTATLSGGTLVGVTPGDVVTIVAGTGTFADKNVGTGKSITASGYTLSGANAANYSLGAQPSGITANITTASLSISGVTASNKVYNGNTTAALAGGTLTGILSGDVVTITAGTGTFADKTIGTGKVVTATGYTLGGANAANYALSAQPSGLTANITAGSLSITGVTASNKAYDGTTTATLTGGTLVGVASGDVVTISAGTGTFADKNVGTGKVVTATGYGISGADAANYTLSAQPSGLTADILASGSSILTITGVTASNKVYDGTTTATLSGGTLVGVTPGDVVTIVAGTGTFADKNVGTGKSITASGYTLSGANAANYSLGAQPSGITANITTASLSISGVTASNKVYNGNTTATLAGGTLTGILSGDVVTITAGTGTFADKTIGTGKVVTATGYTLGGANAANYALSAQPSGLTANITAGSLSITGVTASNKAYDGTTTATLTGGTLVGVASGDVVTITAGTGTFADKNVGTGKVVTATGYGISGADAANYTLSAQPSGLTADILASGSSILTITGVTASNKVYDGTTTATLSGGTLVGVTPGDVVTIVAGTGTFADKNVGTGKSITASGYTLSGANAANYSLGAQPSGITANITTASLSISGVTASNKVYNGNTTATLAGGTLNGILSGDVVTLTAGTGTFADKNVGTGKVVTATGYSIGGADAANYTLSAQPSGITANVTTAPLSVIGMAANNKTYDGTTTATLAGGALSGVLSGEVVNLTAGTGTFANKTIGTGKTVTTSGFSISGTDAANYTLSAQPSGLTANITAGSLSITGVTASNKAYDGTTTATLTGGTLVGVASGDVVTITAGTGTFADKNVGTGKVVTATGYGISGADAANYTLSAQPSGLTADILASGSSILTITGVTASNKVYDGTTTATLSGGTLVGVTPGDVVTIVAGTGTFADKNVGTGKSITASGYTLSGANAANYSLGAQPSGITANITTASLSISGVTASNKVYNGNTTATLAGGTLNGILSGDVVTITAGTGTFADKTIGTGKVVTATGYTLGGANAANYALSAQPSGLTANITAGSLSITGVAASNKAYDGTTTATLTGGTLVGVASGDVVTITAGTGTFADKNVGTGKVVTATGYGISGADAANYTLSAQPSGLTADILASGSSILTITGVTASNKVYDGTTTATLSGGTLVGVTPGDVVTIVAGTGTFADKNVGTGKSITASGYTLSGANAANYSLGAQPSGITANITAAPLSIIGMATYNKVYDGSTSATLIGGALTGILSGDVVTLVAGTGTFASKTIGTGKTVTATGYALSGANASNYVISAQPSGMTANITAASLSITGVTANNKTYDGTTTATLTGGTLIGVASGDVVTISAGTGTFADKNVGTGKTVTATGYGISGADAANYTLSAQPSGLMANIVASVSNTLTITGVTASNKVYDGTTTAVLTGGTLVGVASGDAVTLVLGTGFFADKNVGTGKTVTALGYSLAGANAANYTLTQPSGITANITAASLSITGVAASNKAYDGTTTATLSGGALVGVASGDVVTVVVGTGTFADKFIGSGKVVTASGYGISGTDAANYILSAQPSGITANIVSSGTSILTITGVTASNKVYDRNTTATLTGGTLVGVAAGDVVTLVAGTGTFADRNVGTGKTVTATGYTLSGPNAANYTLAAQPSGITANITPTPLTLTGMAASNKVYDGTTAISLSAGILMGYYPGDVISITAGTGALDTKNVGTAKPVIVSGYSISGTDAANYMMLQPTTVTANVTAIPITITGATASNKVYDGNTRATLTGGTLTGVIAGDSVALTLGTGTFVNKTVGTNKVVTATGYSITGTDAGNYIVLQPSGLKANITAATLTMSSVTVNNKVYDGKLSATLSGGALFGLVTGDDVTLVAGTGTFADKNVGKAKSVLVNGISITGADASNYNFTPSTNAFTADITAAPVTITNIIVNNKVYDKTTSITFTGGTLVGVMSGENVTIVAGTGSFSDKNAGIAKIVNMTGFSITGSDAGNYLLTQPTGVKADITPATLTVAGLTASSKVYDGTTSTNLIGGKLMGILAGDNGSLILGKGNFVDKRVGTAKLVTVSECKLAGSSEGNYVLTQPSDLKADITPATLTISDPTLILKKAYDGTNNATVTIGILSGVASSDMNDISISGIATYNNEIVGADKTITVNYTIGGLEAQNYLTPPSYSVTTGEIVTVLLNTIELTVSAPRVTLSKVYDGTDSVSVTPGVLTGVETADVGRVVLNYTAAYADANIGTGKNIIIRYFLTGLASNKYSIASKVVLTGGEIRRKQLTVSGVSIVKSKVEDGNTLAEITSNGTLHGVAKTDVNKVSLVVDANYLNANVAKNKFIKVTYSLAGIAKDNYIAPVDTMLADATIIQKMVIDEINVAPVNADTSDFKLTYNIIGGTPAEYKFVFDSTAVKAGLENLDFKNLPTAGQNGTITIPVSDYVKEGTYVATLILRDVNGVDSVTQKINFTVNLSVLYIVQLFDDMITCNNIEQRFVDYQWYKDGKPINGATKQVYYEKGGLNGTYYLRVITSTGEIHYSYPKLFTKSTTPSSLPKKAFIYPNPTKSNQPFTVEIQGYNNEELKGAILSIYSVQGLLIYRSDKVEWQNTLSLKFLMQDYYGIIKTAKGVELRFTIKVKN